jgi:hypothetical protein
MKLSADALGIIATLVVGFIAHVFYFGRSLGRFEADFRSLAKSFEDFKSQHFIPRAEYEARHTELVRLIQEVKPRM